MPPNKGNPRGHWEHLGIARIHDRLLEELGSRWDDVSPLPTDWWLSGAAVAARTSIRDLLRREFDAAHLWAVKDPRMCRLLPLWKPILDEAPSKPCFAVIFRHPLEVSESLATRDNIPRTKSLLLWLGHVLDAEEQTRGYPRIFVSMLQVLSDWHGVAESISRDLQVAWPVLPDAAGREIGTFINPGLKHHDASALKPQGDSSLLTLAERAHDALLDASTGRPPSASAILADIRAELDVQMAHPTAAVLFEEARALCRQRMEARKLEEKVAEYASANVRMESELREVRTHLESVLRSRSWRMTAPLRSAYDLARRLLP